MSQSELLEIMRENLGVKTIALTDGMGITRGWDSLAQVQLVLELEARTGKKLSGDLMARLTTVESLANYFLEGKAATT